MHSRLLDRVNALRYVTAAENVQNYRALIECFVLAKDRYDIELRPADVRARLACSGLVHEMPGEADLDRHLDQLVEWGNLQRSQDTTGVASLRDFYRRNYVYRLTPQGEVAHRAVAEVERTVGRQGALQTSMLVEIRDALAALLGAARAADAAATYRALHRLWGAFETLTQEAKLFLGDLDRHLAVDRVDEQRFLAHKQALLAYIGRFVSDVKRLAPEIGALLLELEQDGRPDRGGAADAASPGRAGAPAELLCLAATAAELPPAPGEDPVAAWLARERGRWAGLRAWFLPSAMERPRVDALQAKARESVLRLTRALARLDERHARVADRAADFRTLARWFTEAEGDAAAHTLFMQAFGLHSARHFRVAEDDPELTRASTSWWDARPVEIPVTLRTRGATAHGGRPPPVLSFGDGRAWLAARARRERAQIDAALSRFIGRGRVRLSDLPALDPAELAQLLALLDEALCAPRDGEGARSARTCDGRLLVTLRPAPGTRWVVLATAAGRLRCRDHELEVVATEARRVRACRRRRRDRAPGGGARDRASHGAPAAPLGAPRARRARPGGLRLHRPPPRRARALVRRPRRVGAGGRGRRGVRPPLEAVRPPR